MQWKLSLAVPVLSLLFLATDSNAQDTIPVTVTIPTSRSHAITRVKFPDISDRVFQVDTVRVQHFVGKVGPDSIDGRYRFWIHTYMGRSDIPRKGLFSYAAEALCGEKDADGDFLSEGVIVRLSCSVTQQGVNGGVVCSAIYGDMDDPPDPTCTGTIACTKCNEVRVCGSRPQCE